jgi:hypothetical protein
MFWSIAERICAAPGGGGSCRPGVSRFLQVLAGVRVPGQGGDGRVDGPLRVLVQLRVFSQERFGDRQAGH